MKRKLDFVTNSSSSSFIFTDKELTIRDAAIDMIELIVHEYKTDFPGHGKCSWAASAKKKLKKLDSNTNLILPWSCNYPSFLYRDSDGNIRVDTSWNHKWENLINTTMHTMEYDLEYKRSQKQNFFNLQTGKLKTRIEHRIDEWLYFQKKYGSQKSDCYIQKTIEEMRKEIEEETDENKD
jgi:hypothetical protein